MNMMVLGVSHLSACLTGNRDVQLPPGLVTNNWYLWLVTNNWYLWLVTNNWYLWLVTNNWYLWLVAGGPSVQVKQELFNVNQSVMNLLLATIGHQCPLHQKFDHSFGQGTLLSLLSLDGPCSSAASVWSSTRRCSTLWSLSSTDP